MPALDRPVIRRCVKCDWKFMSPDPARVIRCADCMADPDTYEPRTASERQHAEAARDYRDTS